MESIRKLDLNDLEQIVELRIAIQNFDFSIENMYKNFGFKNNNHIYDLEVDI